MTELNRLFVYGTLMPGDVRWHLLEPYVDGPGQPAEVEGDLFDTGRGYPALVVPGSHRVPGLVFELRRDRLDDALRELDAVEGAAEGLYRRQVVECGGSKAWTYVVGDPALRGTPIASWVARSG